MGAILSPALQGDTFLRAPRTEPSAAKPGQWVVIGAPSEVTKLSRGGTSLGPQEIRRASLVFDFFVRRQSKRRIVDIESGDTYTYDPTPLVDAGDLVLGIDVLLNTERIASAVEQIVCARATPLLLGGDHYVTYPAVTGLARQAHKTPFAYIHVDMHADLLDEVPEFGRLSCASPLRRLLDDGTLAPERTLIYGLDPLLSAEEWEYIRTNGIDTVTNSAIAERGVPDTLLPALKRILDGAAGLYASIDIDVLARTYGPGTGNAVGVTGLTPSDLNEVAEILSRVPLVGGDVVEVAPIWDPSGRTAGIAASTLVRLIWPVLFPIAGTSSSDAMESGPPVAEFATTDRTNHRETRQNYR
jgi:agmatinase